MDTQSCFNVPRYVFLIGFTIAWKRQTNYVVCISVSHDSGKITKKNVKITRSLQIIWWNVNFEEVDSECSAGKKWWWVLITVRNIYGVYRKKYHYRSVKKNNSRSVVIFRLIKNQYCNVKGDPKRKPDSCFDFSQAN